MGNCTGCEKRRVDAAKAKASLQMASNSTRTDAVTVLLNLRALGATKIKVGDVEAEWPPMSDCGCSGHSRPDNSHAGTSEEPG